MDEALGAAPDAARVPGGQGRGLERRGRVGEERGGGGEERGVDEGVPRHGEQGPEP